jgi:hypothetical protein
MKCESACVLVSDIKRAALKQAEAARQHRRDKQFEKAAECERAVKLLTLILAGQNPVITSL